MSCAPGRSRGIARLRLKLFLIAAAALVCSAQAAGSSAAQDAGSRPRHAAAQAGPADEDEIIRVETAEVLLPVTVRDANGHLVTALGREDFRVFEDGREQPLSALDLRRVPVDVVMMIDASSSVAAEADNFRRAVDEFAARLAEDDRFSLVKFDDEVRLLQDWTRSRAQLRRALARIKPGMFTRFNDALYLSAREQLAPGSSRRRAVVALTDGVDSGRGSVTADGALRALLESQATVYVISNTVIERARKLSELESLSRAEGAAARMNELRIGSLRESLRVLDESERNLARLCEATGGRLYRPESFGSLGEVYGEVAEELRSQYALYYRPLNKSRDGRFRSVRVVTKDAALRVSARVGYYAPRG